MPRTIILLFVSVLAAASYCQPEKRDINKAGIKFDVNSSIFIGDISDTNDIAARTGFSLGLFYREALGSIFGGQIEVRYVQMGGVYKQQDAEVHLDYLRLGAQFKLYPLTSTLGANAFLGFEYGILISAQQEDPVNKGSFFDVKDFFKSGDYGIHFGVGLDFDFGLTTDLRLYLGLADINETKPDARNLSTQFHLGWGF